METFKHDLIYGLRMLRKSPAFTIVAALTLALGIGANTAIFSMVDSLVLRPLPVRQPDQITVLASQQGQSFINQTFSVPEYRDVAAQSTDVFSAVFTYQFGMDGLSEGGKAERILSNFVSSNFFTALGIKPALGRFILPGEGETVGTEPIIVLSYSYWKKRFGGDPGVIGRRVLVDGKPLTIVGVTPPEFYGIFPMANVQAYMPLGMMMLEGNAPDFMTNRAFRNVVPLARLKDGVTLEQARSRLNVIAQRMSADNPKEEKDMRLLAFAERRARPNPDPQNTMLVVSGLFLGLAVMVLLLACLNVANILLVRATIREGEMAIRSALGAARSRLIRQLLTESVLLALVGAVGGIALGRWASAAVSSLNLAIDIPIRLDFSFDWRVFTYALGAALLTGIVVGIVPALRASRGNINAVLHKSGRSMIAGHSRMRSALVIAQVAGSLMLLIVAGLFTRSLSVALHSDLGFNPNHVLDMSMDPAEVGFSETQGLQFYKSLLERARQLPGVQQASLTSYVPLGYFNNGDNLVIDGYDQAPGLARPYALESVVMGDYLGTVQVPVISGRNLAESDNETAPYVAVINETTAQKYWPKQDPIGRQFKLASDAKHSIRIVGVARNARSSGAKGPIGAQIYLPLAQHYTMSSLQTLLLRTNGDPGALVPEATNLVHSLAPDLPLFDVRPMVVGINTLNGLLMYRIGAGLAASLGALGLVLSVVGVYGVLSYSAAQRTQEIGIRVALGATPRSILALVLRQGLAIVGIGLAVGLGFALAASKVVGSFLAVSPRDPITYFSVTALLTLVALTACYLPARRTTRVDPMRALRHE
jgi:predicted permease